MRELLSALEERMAEPSVRGLVGAVSSAIRDGVLRPGTRLPPIRTVAAELGLSATTVSAAWSLLGRSGTIRADGRRGTTISDIGIAGARRYRRALHREVPFRLDLSTGVPDPRLLPDLTPALRSLTTAATPGSYLDPPMLPELLDVLAEDWPYRAEGFAITDGAMDALEQVARVSLRFGDRVLVEHPCFPPLLDLLEAVGADIQGVPVDGHGVVPQALAAALEHKVAAVILQPRAQNPTGASMTEQRVREIVDVLTPTQAWVIEDDSAGAIAQADPISVGQWLPERTLHIRSFSKSHGPDLRLAAVSGPADLIGEMTARRQLGQGWSSRLLQRILLHLLTDPQAGEQVQRARAEYARRRDVAVRGLRELGAQVGDGDGINLWLPVADESAATVRLASQGVGVAPGSPFQLLPSQTPHVRVTVGLLASSDADWVIPQLAAAAETGRTALAR